MSSNSLIYARDETGTNRVLECSNNGFLSVGITADTGSTISIADYTTPSNTLKIDNDGSIDVNVISGGGTGGALQATLADETVVAVEAVEGTEVGTYALSTSDINNLYYGTSAPTTNEGALLVYDLSGGGGGGGALEATATDGTVVAVEAVAGTEAGKYSLATSDIKQTYTTQTAGTSTRNFVNSYSKLVGNSASTVEHVALMDTAGRLQVNARISDTSGGGLASTSVGGVKALNVVDLNNKYTGTGSNALLNVNVGNAEDAPANMRISSIADTSSTNYEQNTLTGKEISTGVFKYGLDVSDINNKYYGATAPTEFLGSLLTYQVNSTSSTPVGALNNIHSGTLTAGASSTGLNIDSTYGNESVLSYQDSTTGATLYVSIWGSFDNTTWFYLGVMAPTTVVRTTIRVSVAVLKLAGVKYIRITNEETATTLTGITATLISG